MAPVLLNIAPSLRPWRYAGVRRLLVDEATAERLAWPPDQTSQPDQTCQPDQAARPAQAHQPAQATASAQAVQPRQPERPVRPVQAARPNRVRQPDQADAALSASPANPQNSPHSKDGPALLPPARWALFWQDLLRKTPPHPTLLWTYPGLDRDLSGQADADHRAFLQRLIADIALPKGSHAFWPLTAWPPAEEEALDANKERPADAAHFLSGVARLNPRTAFFMTGTPPAGLGISHLRLLQPAIVRGRRFVVTPHVETLIKEPGRYSQLISFLKALLNQGM